MINFNQTFIIAEIGVNHEGSISEAKQLVSLAKQYGFNAVKFQHIVPSRIWHGSFPAERRLGPKETLPDTWLYELVDHAHNLGVLIGCTPTFQGSSTVIAQTGCDFIKVASPQARYDKFILDEALQTELPLIVSNGYCNTEESLSLIEYLQQFSRRNPVAFLFCVAEYPSDGIRSNPAAIRKLADACRGSGIAFGLSDHNQSLYNSLVIKHEFLGTVFEKHFSHEHGSSLDQDVSIHSWQAREYVRQLSLPSTHDNKLREENLVDKSFVFASSFFLSRDVLAGSLFNFTDCIRLRDGKSHSFDTCSAWSMMRNKPNLRYKSDMRAGQKLHLEDLE